MSSPTATPLPTSAYSAAGPALGYLAQIEYALLLLLQRMDFEEQSELTIEAVDDVTFHAEDGSALEQIQTKHHIGRTAKLGDSSVDLWKTIHNWIAEAGGKSTSRLVIMTTAEASDGSIASLLRDDTARDAPSAAARLSTIATNSQSRTNEPYYKAFLSLDDSSRSTFVSRIVVLDNAARATETTGRLRMALRLSVSNDRRDALIDRLRGWWYRRALSHLSAIALGKQDSIFATEVEEAIVAIATSLHAENLPIDYEQEPFPHEVDLEQDERIFVAQLKLIAMGSQRMRVCIHDHNRAYLQRSRWQRDRLLHIGELTAYDARLEDEWRRHSTPLIDEEDEFESEKEVCKRAREAYRNLDTRQLPAIRPQIQASFVANGSLHILADRLQIGWHPEWLHHLRDRIHEVRDSIANEEIA